MDEKKVGSVERVRLALEAKGANSEIERFDQSTRTAADAAAAIGCSVGQIAKSLIFRAKKSERPVLVIARGDGRVNEKKVAAVLGEKIGRADADFVRARTGFAIGGVAPVGHTEEVVCFIDADLQEFKTVWAAAGAPNAVFRTSPGDLVWLSGGTEIEMR